MILLKMLLCILLQHAVCLDLVSFPSPLVLLRDIHDGLLVKYDCKDNAPPPAQPGARARPARESQDDGASQQEAAHLFLPRLDRLYEASSRGEDSSNDVTIPAQHRVT